MTDDIELRSGSGRLLEKAEGSLDGLVMALDHLGLISVSGRDAADFLQNQLTNDVQSLSPTEARLAGLCSPKGRLLADFLYWRDGESFYLQCLGEIRAPIQKRLGMYVLRAKAQLGDASESHRSIGLAGAKARSFLQTQFANVPEEASAIAKGAAGILIRVADSFGLARWQWVIPADLAEQKIQSAFDQLKAADASIWRWLEIRAGIPHIGLATQDRFIPQMINFEALGGVSFTKGCYPGQEVVARSQYLGKLKRRMRVAHLQGAGPKGELGQLPGSDVRSVPADGSSNQEPIGLVVNAEISPFGGIDLLAELPVAAMDSDGTDRRLGVGPLEAEALVELLDLPYTLPDQDIFVRPKL